MKSMNMNFGDRMHAAHRRADAQADDAGFADRRIDDAVLAVLFEHARA